jgi:hypothetical protein
MWDADQDDDAAFESRLANIVREIGDRGKLMVPQAVLPLEPTPAPAPAPAPASASTPIPMMVPAPAPAAPVLPARTVAPAPAPAPAPTVATPPLDPSRLMLERDSLMQQVQQLSSQLAGVSIDTSSSGVPPQSTAPSGQQQLSESFYLERERAERQAERQQGERQAERERAERMERAAERERVERAEARLLVAFSVSTCSCAIGAAIVGAAVLLKRG